MGNYLRRVEALEAIAPSRVPVLAVAVPWDADDETREALFSEACREKGVRPEDVELTVFILEYAGAARHN